MTETLSPFAPLLDSPVGLGSLPAALVAAGTLGALGVLNLAAPRLGLLDHPDGGRKRHAQAVPLTGGLAILIGAGLGTVARA